MVALPIVILVFLVVLHVLALHEVGSNNPDGVDIKKHKDANGVPLDGIAFHPYYTVKDMVGVVVFLLIFAAVFFFAPNFVGYFLESPNFELANPFNTPQHHAGLVLHAVLRDVARHPVGVRHAGVGRDCDGRRCVRAVFRAVAGSLAGTVDTLQGADLQGDAGAVFHLLHMPRGLRHEAAIGYLSDPGADCTAIYFAFFLLMPWYTRMDSVKPEPERVTGHA